MEPAGDAMPAGRPRLRDPRPFISPDRAAFHAACPAGTPAPPQAAVPARDLLNSLPIKTMET
ncbi:hypothetical protein SAMN05421850_12018 [Lutimaribacter saemankumensis]|uniref:Uncharacterized protein n=1 Tax=Lutimaribacter saemankumensis TaxID=490829 RepID=A0A1G8TD31_9RHOB|nr:hypothetical protein SAMN05421850_12018 [Lutimaribacter saemankumensis]